MRVAEFVRASGDGKTARSNRYRTPRKYRSAMAGKTIREQEEPSAKMRPAQPRQRDFPPWCGLSPRMGWDFIIEPAE